MNPPTKRESSPDAGDARKRFCVSLAARSAPATQSTTPSFSLGTVGVHQGAMLVAASEHHAVAHPVSVASLFATAALERETELPVGSPDAQPPSKLMGSQDFDHAHCEDLQSDTPPMAENMFSGYFLIDREESAGRFRARMGSHRTQMGGTGSVRGPGAEVTLRFQQPHRIKINPGCVYYLTGDIGACKPRDITLLIDIASIRAVGTHRRRVSAHQSPVFIFYGFIQHLAKSAPNTYMLEVGLIDDIGTIAVAYTIIEGTIDLSRGSMVEVTGMFSFVDETRDLLHFVATSVIPYGDDDEEVNPGESIPVTAAMDSLALG